MTTAGIFHIEYIGVLIYFCALKIQHADPYTSFAKIMKVYIRNNR